MIKIETEFYVVTNADLHCIDDAQEKIEEEIKRTSWNNLDTNMHGGVHHLGQ